MPSVQRTILVSEQLDDDISRELQQRGFQGWSAGVVALLEEAVRTARIPGIVFVQSRARRRAAVAFTGLDVWEIIAIWKDTGENPAALAEAYPELSDAQRGAALTYYRAYPEEIDARLEREAYWTPERVAEEFPFTHRVTR